MGGLPRHPYPLPNSRVVQKLDRHPAGTAATPCSPPALGFGAGEGPNAAEMPPTVGKLQTAMLFVDFADARGPELPDGIYRTFSQRIVDLYRTISYSRLEIEMVPLRRWLRLPRTLPSMRVSTSRVRSRQLSRLQTQCSTSLRSTGSMSLPRCPLWPRPSSTTSRYGLMAPASTAGVGGGELDASDRCPLAADGEKDRIGGEDAVHERTRLRSDNRTRVGAQRQLPGG
jgi:hypothetical protein